MVKIMKKLLVGITGMSGAGKGAVVDFLKQKGFKHFSAYDLLMEEARKRNMPENRDSLICVGNELRKQFGSGFVAEELIKKAKLNKGNSIVESIRTVGEVETLKRLKGILLSVDADQKIRFERIKKRGGVKDNVSWKEFIDQEVGESQSDDTNKQNLIACRNMADFVVDNNGLLEDLQKQINIFLKKYE
jgi:dephospho-CoA kinase